MYYLVSRIKHLLLWCFILLLGSATAGASGLFLDRIVTGTITEASGQPLIGASIVAIGNKSIATISDENGFFSLRVPDEIQQLEISYVGYVTQTLVIPSSNVLNVVLGEDNNVLKEFVVVGYGVEQKKLLTGSVGIVQGDDLKKLPLTNVDVALQGQTSGIQVIQNSGTPGAEMSVRIRGTSSIGASSQPLYVIDGIPVTTGDFAQVGYEGQGVNALSDLNPADIESISILKDAAAATIYGARASNGVVLITTKRGKEQKTVFNVNTSYGIQQTWKRLNMLNAHDWKIYRNDLAGTQVYSQEQINDNTVDVNWQDQIFRTAPMKTFDLSAMGGTDKTKFFISGNVFDQDGIVGGTDFSKLSGRINLDHKATSRLTIGTSIGLTHTKTDRVEGDQSLHGPLPNGISTPAIFSVYNADGSYNQSGPYSNAVSIIKEAINQNFSNRALANAYLEYKIIDGLTFNTKWGIDFLNFREHAYENTKTVQGARYNGLGFETFTNVSNLVSNNTLRYNFDIDASAFEILAGYSFEKRNTVSSFIRAQDYADQSLQYINSASTIVSASSGASNSGIRSFFGRANYNLHDKYLVTFSARVDGSSRFSEKNRNGFFPAVSAAWRISQESFFKSSTISELKLRGSYGLTGNDDIPAFLYASLYGNTTYAGQPAIYPSSIPNPNLRWETTAQSDLGIDLGLSNDRFVFGVDVYYKKTKDLLLDRPLPGSSGYSSILENIGEIENKGLEFSFHSENLKDTKLRWNTNLNFSMNRNKVLKLYNGQPIDDLGRGSNRIEEGQPIGIFYSYEWLGVDPSTGDVVYADKNFDGKITADDRTKIGSPHPSFIYGLTNNFSYGDFDLSVFLQGVQGNDIFNGTRLFLESLQGGDNQLAIINERWRKPGDITKIPRATNDPVAASQNKRVSSRFLEDGSYLRIKNVSLSYTMRHQGWMKDKIQSIRFFVTGQNLMTFTNYSGLDPEVNYRGNDNAVIGTDFFTYPQARSYVFGINASF